MKEKTVERGGLMKKKGWLYRAIRTFLQVSIGYLAGALPALVGDVPITKSMIAGLLTTAISTGLAAVMNLKDGNDDQNNQDNQGQSAGFELTETEIKTTDPEEGQGVD